MIRIGNKLEELKMLFKKCAGETEVNNVNL